MIKVEHLEAFNFEGALRGMRNPLNSHNKSDSCWVETIEPNGDLKEEYVIGDNDLDLMKRLFKAGTEHRKYLRQIFVSMDITAPLYWWKQADKYQIGVTTNSYSTMHTIHKKPFDISDFSFEGVDDMIYDEWIKDIVFKCENLRKLYVVTKEKKYWDALIKLLPESYNQKRTVTMNYENVINIIKQRTGHKIKEWDDFITELKKLPYIKELIEENS